MKNLTLIKLAQILDLSKSTVARAFEPNSDINPKTRDRILEKAAELNFQPDYFAASLRKRSSKTIAIIVPDIADMFFSRAIGGIENYAQGREYSVLIYNTQGLINTEQRILQQLANGRVDGFIISASGWASTYDIIHNLFKKNMPCVLFDKGYTNIEIPKVLTNDSESSFLATEHLINNGCNKIVCAVVDQEFSIGKERVVGFKKALEKFAIEFSENLVITCTNNLSENINIMKEVIRIEKPDGILATAETLAHAVYFASNEEKIKIPNDIKLVSFSNLDIAPLLNPSLSTITQPAFEMGRMAAEILFNQIYGEKILNNRTILKSRLIVRDSSS